MSNNVSARESANGFLGKSIGGRFRKAGRTNPGQDGSKDTQTGKIIQYETYIDHLKPKVIRNAVDLATSLKNYMRKQRYGFGRAVGRFAFRFDLRGNVTIGEEAGCFLQPVAELYGWNNVETLSDNFPRVFAEEFFLGIGFVEIEEHLGEQGASWRKDTFAFFESPSTPQVFLIQFRGRTYILDAAAMTDEEVFMTVANWAVKKPH